MFKFLKNKIKDAVSKFSKSAEEEAQEEERILEETELSAVTEEQPVEELDQSEQVAQEPAEQDVVEQVESEVEPVVEDKSEEVKVEVEEKVVESEPEPEEKVAEVKATTLEQPVREEQALEELQETLTELEPDSKQDFEPEQKVEETVVESEPASEPDVNLEPTPQETSESSEVVKELSQEEQDELAQLEEELELEDIDNKETPTDPITGDVLDVEETDDAAQEYDEVGKKKGFFGKLFGRKEVKEEVEKDVQDDVQEEVEKDVVQEEPIVTTESELESELKSESESLLQQEEKPEPILPAEEISEEKVAEPKASKDVVRKELFESSDDSTKKKKGFFGKLKERVVKFQLTDEKFEELFWDFEMALMENNVALEVIEKIKKDMHAQLTQENVTRKSVEEVIIDTLKKSLEEILNVPSFDLLEQVKSKRPYIICMTGVNGSGKTTTLAKLIHYFQKNNLSVVVAAADTFRAAAIQQLEEHTNKLGVKLIKHDYNADPAAVAFDAIKHATAKQLDVVLIDTAGRLQSNNNLMDELKKLIRVNKPDLNIFIVESITGNDCVEQAVAFNDAVGIDGIILSKADVDDKGGAAISVSYVTGKPILYLGTGQTYDDLEPFDKEKILANLGL